MPWHPGTPLDLSGPDIIKESGKNYSGEGCLKVPKESGEIDRNVMESDNIRLQVVEDSVSLIERAGERASQGERVRERERERERGERGKGREGGRGRECVRESERAGEREGGAGG